MAFYHIHIPIRRRGRFTLVPVVLKIRPGYHFGNPVLVTLLLAAEWQNASPSRVAPRRRVATSSVSKLVQALELSRCHVFSSSPEPHRLVPCFANLARPRLPPAQRAKASSKDSHYSNFWDYGNRSESLCTYTPSVSLPLYRVSYGNGRGINRRK